MNINSHLLGDLLKSMGIISETQLEEALQLQNGFISEFEMEADIDPARLVTETREKGRNVPMLGEIMLEKGFITKDLLEPVLAMQNRQIRELLLLSSEKLAMIIQTGFIINSTVDLANVLSLIMKYANIVTDAEASTLMLLDEKTGELVFSIPTGPTADELEDNRIPPGVGIAGWVLQNQQYVLVEDAQKDPRFYCRVDDMTGTKTKSLLCVPMRSKRKIIGVLEVINKNNMPGFTEEDALLLNLFSHQAAIAIDNATLFSSVQKGKQDKE